MRSGQRSNASHISNASSAFRLEQGTGLLANYCQVGSPTRNRPGVALECGETHVGLGGLDLCDDGLANVHRLRHGGLGQVVRLPLSNEALDEALAAHFGFQYVAIPRIRVHASLDRELEVVHRPFQLVVHRRSTVSVIADTVKTLPWRGNGGQVRRRRDPKLDKVH